MIKSRRCVMVMVITVVITVVIAVVLIVLLSVYLHNVQLSYTTVRKELKSREALPFGIGRH